MKKTLSILLLLIAFNANATNYYLSATGSDGSGGTSIPTAWQSISKLNASFSSMSTGDSVLFRRGDTFVGSMLINTGIKIGTYGTGANPIISCLYTIPAWTSLGSNIYESTSAVSTLSYLNIVLINGVNTAMGRTPNTGYYHYQSHVGRGQITSSDLSGTPNWTGAELAVFITTYGLNRCPITSQSSGTVNFIFDSVYQENIQSDGQGFFIQNDVRTLDAQNEWYYNPSTKKLRIYSTTSPTNVQVPLYEVATEIHNGAETNDVTINDIDFIGANSDLLVLKRVQNCSITNCNFSFAGRNAIQAPYWGASVGNTISNCTFTNNNNTGIALTEQFTNTSITNNTFNNTGIIAGMGAPANSYADGGLYTAIHAKGKKNIIDYNRIINTGYNGIVFTEDSSKVRYNFIDTALTVLRDGGGIYTFNGNSGANRIGMEITDNIVMNIVDGEGIYLDDKSNGILVKNNTVVNCYDGFYLHNNWDIQVLNNTAYANIYAALNIYNDDAGVHMHDLVVKNNKFIGKLALQRAAFFYPMDSVVAGLSVADSNYYAVPIDDNLTIDGYYMGSWGRKTLAQWKTISGQEVHSNKSPKTISDVADFRMEYNETVSSKVVNLGGYNWIDMDSTTYSGTLTLAPYTSIILLKGANMPPIPNAGIDQIIRLKYFQIRININ